MVKDCEDAARSHRQRHKKPLELHECVPAPLARPLSRPPGHADRGQQIQAASKPMCPHPTRLEPTNLPPCAVRKTLRRQLKESGPGPDGSMGRLLAEYGTDNMPVRKRGSATSAEVATAAAAAAVTAAAAASSGSRGGLGASVCGNIPNAPTERTGNITSSPFLFPPLPLRANPCTTVRAL